MLNPSLRCLVLLSTTALSLPAQAPVLTHGPFRGHVDTTSMHVWARAAAAGSFTLQLTSLADAKVATATAVATAERDFTLHFVADGLTAGTAFAVRLLHGEQVLFDRATWTTALPDDAGAATVVFGSCAHEKAFPEQPIWGRILTLAPQALVLLGDTPYIDLGTVAARRQRHREFFAHPAIAATLQAIPTWTTWDDHDYAANDEFGAVPGSETARPVFVDYHAHAGYGDGQRGIHTRFRQGPIEVFVLDARTFADSEPSPLAPGERTLLGKAQLEWLQQGLLASTATFRVLACGMVWNEGVRSGKKDCWGHWRPERDALFRWLGERRIGGVVLLSGDVHRSRVVLHPTKALCGYDIPEFVTSPLAQNVLESNAVPVAGLVFDAGEASSCLALTATRGAGADDGALRAVFLAGDGREFHRRELTAADLQRPDAAVGYRRVVAALRLVFGEHFEGLPEQDVEAATFEPTAAAARGDAWRAAVQAAMPAFAAWSAAAAEGPCRFRATSAEPLMSEFMQDVFLGLQSMQRLAVARCLQAIGDRDAALAVQTAAALLATARHLQQEPGGIAWSVAGSLEGLVVALHAEIGKELGAEPAAALRDRIREHLAARAGLAGLAAALRIETFRLFDASLATMQLGRDRKAQAARTLVTEVRRHFVASTGPFFAAADAVDETNVATTVAELERLGQELAQRRRARLQALRQLDAEGKLDGDAAADLALLLATLVVPNVAHLLTEHAATLDRLRDVAR